MFKSQSAPAQVTSSQTTTTGTDHNYQPQCVMTKQQGPQNRRLTLVALKTTHRNSDIAQLQQLHPLTRDFKIHLHLPNVQSLIKSLSTHIRYITNQLRLNNKYNGILKIYKMSSESYGTQM